MGTAAADDAAATDDEDVIVVAGAEEAAGCNGAPHLDCFADMVVCERCCVLVVEFSGFSVCGLPSISQK